MSLVIELVTLMDMSRAHYIPINTNPISGTVEESNILNTFTDAQMTDISYSSGITSGINLSTNTNNGIYNNSLNNLSYSNALNASSTVSDGYDSITGNPPGTNIDSGSSEPNVRAISLTQSTANIVLADNANAIIASYEGENYTSQLGGSIQTEHSPYTGSGYYDFGYNSSDYVEWNNIFVAQAGTYTLLFKYANGSNINRPCNLAVNNTVTTTIPFAPTTNWDTWGDNEVVVRLNSGTNTVRLTANTTNGGPNIDNILLSNGNSPIPLETQYYEGENYTKQLGGTIQTEHYPYIGSGYYDFGYNRSDYVEWGNISVSQAGSYTLLFKYANGSSANRECNLEVNNTVIKTIPFTPTANWDTWWNGRVVVQLNSGTNTVKLTTNTVNGGPNIDNMAVSSGASPTPPGTQYNVRNYGAKGNGSTNDTAAIQAAINACNGTNGSVVLDNGTFMAGHIELKSNMTFWISDTATLKAIQNNNLYPASAEPNTNNVSVADELGISFVYSNRANNLTITGGGKIDGNNANSFWNGYIEDESVRPIPVYLTQGSNIKLTNLDIVHGAMWTVVPLECDNVTIDGINIDSNTTENCDGIDICDSHNVTISNSTIISQDDSICLKSGNSIGVQNLMVKNITINKVTDNQIKFGTKSYGYFKDIVMEDIAGTGTNLAGIAIESVDGADIDNLTFNRIKMNNVGTPIFILHGAGARNWIPVGEPSKYGSVSNINISNVECRGVTNTVGSSIMGTYRNGNTYRPTNITLTNINVQSFKGGLVSIPGVPTEYNGDYPEYDMWGDLPAWAYYIRHAQNINFINCTQNVSPSDARQAIVKNDVI